MSDAPRPGPWRLGLVPYLNVQPLVWHIQRACAEAVHLESAVPRELAARLFEGHYDAAIVPVFEYFRHPEAYNYVPGAAIASDGNVLSVMLFAEQPMETLDTIILDKSSLTSVHLFQVLAREGGYNFRFVDSAAAPATPLPHRTGAVVIGDPALARIGQHAYEYDLAALWKERTGLPFVFAAWLTPRGVDARELARLLAKSREIGTAHLPEVAAETAGQFGATPDFALQYFRENLLYDLTPAALEGWREFGRLCAKHQLIPANPTLRSCLTEP